MPRVDDTSFAVFSFSPKPAKNVKTKLPSFGDWYDTAFAERDVRSEAAPPFTPRAVGDEKVPMAEPSEKPAGSIEASAMKVGVY